MVNGIMQTANVIRSSTRLGPGASLSLESKSLLATIDVRIAEDEKLDMVLQVRDLLSLVAA